MTTWRHHMDRLHGDDRVWHYSIDSIVLSSVALLLNAMHDVNMYIHGPCFFFKFLVYDYQIIKIFDIFLSPLLGLWNQIMSRQIWFTNSIVSKVLESGSWRNLKIFLPLINTPSV